MPTLLNTFFTGPSPGAMHAAGPPVAGQVVRASSAMDCQYSNSVSQRSQR